MYINGYVSRLWRRYSAVVAVLLMVPLQAYGASVSMTKGNTGAIVKWSKTPVSFQLHPACSADLNANTCLNEVRKSFKAWEPPTCSNLKFTEGPASYNLKLTAVGGNTNGKNEFAWIETNAWIYGTYVLGVTSPVFTVSGPSNGTINEADIAMNGYLQKWSVSGQNYTTDVMNVSVHEIGHFFGLQHNLYPNNSKPETMAPSADPFMGSRTPEQDDIDGLCFLYPTGKGLTCSTSKDCPYVVDDGPSGEYYAGQIGCNSGVCNGPAASVPTGGKKLGDACLNSSDCDSPLFCQPISGSSSVCSQQCNPQQSGSCPNGYTCYGYQGSTTQGACIKSQGGGNTGPKKKIGETCTASTQCESQLCVGSGGAGTCQKLCTSDAQCDAKQQCSKFSGKNYGACVDAPQSGGDKKDNGETCTLSTQCKSDICVGTGATGTCLADCDSKPCPANTNCMPLSGGKKGCIPGGPKKLGEACQTGLECNTSVCAPAAGKYICTQLCGGGKPACPSGYSCTQINANTSVCLPASSAKAGNGEKCASSNECASGMCVGTGTSGTCLQPCTSNQQCPDGYGCASLQSGGGACIELGDKKIGDPCDQSSQCKSASCYDLGGGAVCTAQCTSSVDCPCGFECKTYQGNTKLCAAGAKLSCVELGAACAKDSECKSDLCLNGACVESCSIFAGSKACADANKGCVRLEANQPKGVCSTKGPEGFGANCANDTSCASLFCHQGKCGEPCNPFGPNTCNFNMTCSVATGNVGACQTPAGGGETDAGSAQPDAGSSTPDVGGTSDGGTGVFQDANSGSGGAINNQPADSGGLCSASTSGDPAPMAALLVLAALAMTLRRRRRA